MGDGGKTMRAEKVLTDYYYAHYLGDEMNLYTKLQQCAIYVFDKYACVPLNLK